MDMQTLKGRNTIRKNGSVTGATGQASRIIKRWRFSPEPNTLLARLETAYMSGLDAVDRIEMRATSNKTSGKFTRDGSRDDVLNYALNSLIPDLHKARMAIKRAKAEVAERKSKLKVDAPDPTDVAAAFRRMEARTFLREMQSDARAKYFASHSDNLPADIAMAVLELPPEFSGVTAPQHERLTQSATWGNQIKSNARINTASAPACWTAPTSRRRLIWPHACKSATRWRRSTTARLRRFSWAIPPHGVAR